MAATTQRAVTDALDELSFNNTAVSMCMLVNRRHATVRVIDFRAGATLAKRNFVLNTARREGIEKLFVLVERDEVHNWVVGREWILSQLPNELTPALGNFDRIADGELEITCAPVYGTNFKKGLIERVGLNPENTEPNFAFIREAIAAEAGDDKVDEMLIRFDLNNPGHRVDLVFMVRKYITEVLPLTPRLNWSPEANQAVTELEGKILAIRLDYAARINAAWEAYEAQYATESWGFSQLIDNIDESGFVWPGAARRAGRVWASTSGPLSRCSVRFA